MRAQIPHGWTVSYSEYSVPADLAEVVECFWAYDGMDFSTHRIVPDGRCELIAHLAHPYVETQDDAAQTQPVLLFAGQLTRPLHLRGEGSTICLAARFSPAAAGRFLGFNAANTTDRRLPLDDRSGPAGQPLTAALAGLRSAERQLPILAGFIRERLAASVIARNRSVEIAVSLFERQPELAVSDVAARCGTSMRGLQRMFRTHVGVAPRLFASIIRFRRIFDVLSSGGMSFGQAAQESGYCDQAQMAREFQRFLGCSARRFISERDALAAALTRSRDSAGPGVHP